MTHSFATHFGQVIALDVSAEMLDRAQQMLQAQGNIAWAQTNGSDLSAVASESVDFAFSYLVLQHLPETRLVRGYIQELFRVLGVNGVCLFQFNGMVKPTMNWKGTFAWGCIDALWSMHLPGLSRSLARLVGFDPDMAGKSWHGTAMTTPSIVEVVRASGGKVLEMSGEGTPMAWCCARKLERSFRE
jgi:SAM-dependent methyltransferase